MEIKECDKVTREMVKSIEVGSFGIFTLPTFAKVESAKATATQVGNLLKCKFSICSYDEEGAPEYTIKISRLT